MFKKISKGMFRPFHAFVLSFTTSCIWTLEWWNEFEVAWQFLSWLLSIDAMRQFPTPTSDYRNSKPRENKRRACLSLVLCSSAPLQDKVGKSTFEIFFPNANSPKKIPKLKFIIRPPENEQFSNFSNAYFEPVWHILGTLNFLQGKS